ncbi:hypothetical protein KUCAC02_022655 [Chaenocephalus aceratus]|uniref:Uncharacterized protein n=1 Tax=Chaenocephalus aceratus TaxID=36190 RepID=A0ACB9XMM6_CHAAC|nr:hypothetical protein KUCAC02_022655 [Chaenocephalus aceratus]
MEPEPFISAAHASSCQLMPAPTRTCPKWEASRPGRGPRKHHIRTVPSPTAPPFPQIHGQSVPSFLSATFSPLCVPDNGAQLLSAKGSVAARE